MCPKIDEVLWQPGVVRKMFHVIKDDLLFEKETKQGVVRTLETCEWTTIALDLRKNGAKRHKRSSVRNKK